jgi:peptidoglycan/xylan/chitin deacetylase (PgdA/CDA1 family)
MKIVSPLLKHVLYPSLAKPGILRRAAGPGLAVVTYHGILPQGYRSVDRALDDNLIDGQMFRRQLRLLKSRYKVIAPEDFLTWCRQGCELRPLSVLLTCDDGLRNNLTDMLPVLQEEGVRCLFFVTGASASDQPASLWYEELFLMLHAARCDTFSVYGAGIEMHGELGSRISRQATWWRAVKLLSQIDAERRRGFLRAARAELAVSDEISSGGDDSPRSRRFHLLPRTELVQLELAGMTIGAHTISHPMLSQCSPEVARAEIAESRTQLQAALGRPVWALAYPFGDAESVTPQIVAMAKEAGYEAAFLNIGGGLGASIARFAIPRIHVTAGMTLGEFEAHVAGFHGSLQRWTRRAPQYAALSMQG